MISYGFVMFVLWFCYVFLMVLLCFLMVFYSFVMSFFMVLLWFLIVKLNPKGTVISGRVGGGINFLNFYWGVIPIGGAALRMVISYWGGGPQ